MCTTQSFGYWGHQNTPPASVSISNWSRCFTRASSTETHGPWGSALCSFLTISLCKNIRRHKLAEEMLQEAGYLQSYLTHIHLAHTSRRDVPGGRIPAVLFNTHLPIHPFCWQGSVWRAVSLALLDLPHTSPGLIPNPDLLTESIRKQA